MLLLTFNLFPPRTQKWNISGSRSSLDVNFQVWDTRISVGASWSSGSRGDREWTIQQSDLPDGEPYEVTKEIPVRIIKAGDLEYVATFEDANISIGGISKHDAFQALVYDVLDTFDYLNAHQPELGPAPRRQLAVMSRHLVKTKR